MFGGIVLIAQSLDPTVFLQFARLTASLANMKALFCGDSDALLNGFILTVHGKAQSAKFLFYLEDFKPGFACRLELGN